MARILGNGHAIGESMTEGKLKFDGGEIELGRSIVTIGRASDNAIAFPSDSNISRYHAEIEPRGLDHILIDLGSSNGTAVNGQPVTGEVFLKDGDKIVLGKSQEITVDFGGAADETADSDDDEYSAGSGMSGFSSGGGASLPSVGSMSAGGGAAAATSGSGGGSRAMIAIAAVVVGVALVCVVVAAGVYLMRGSGCHATAVVTAPEPGDVIKHPTDVEVDAKDAECVATAVFTLDGNEIARTDEQPFTAKLDPSEYPELADGFDHNLGIVLIDQKGEQIPQSTEVNLGFDTIKVAKPDATPGSGGTDTPPTQPNSTQKVTGATLLDVRNMATNVLKSYPSSANYSVANQQMLQAIQKAINDYAKDGNYARAAQYRDAINVSYAQEQNLDAGIGFLLALSRSGFDPSKKGANEGLWQMTNDFVTANAYNGQCANPSLSDQAQTCAAKASALYMKALIINVFDGDVIYGVAAFGKSPADAAAWKATLPANRADIWNSIKGQQERDLVVRYLAAGIVSENPQKFGMKDHPMSELYRITQ